MDKRNGTIKDKAIIIGIGIIIGVAVTFIFMLVLAMIISIFCLDKIYALPFATISSAFGCFSASFFSAKKIGERGYLIGILTGLAVFILVIVISLLTSSDEISKNTLFHFIIMVLSAAIGGITGVHKKNKKII